MHWVEAVDESDQLVSAHIFEDVWWVKELIEVIHVSAALLLGGKVTQNRDLRWCSKQVVFFHGVHLEIDPEIRVIYAEKVHEACSFHKILLIGKCDQVYA